MSETGFNLDRDILSRSKSYLINRKKKEIPIDNKGSGFYIEYLWTAGHYNWNDRPRFSKLKELHEHSPFSKGEASRSIILCRERNTAEKAALTITNYRTTDVYPEYIYDEKRMKTGRVRDEEEEMKTVLFRIPAREVKDALTEHAIKNGNTRIRYDRIAELVPDDFENIIIEVKDERCLDAAEYLLFLYRDIKNIIVWIGPGCKDTDKIIKDLIWDYGDFNVFNIREPSDEEIGLILKETASFYRISFLQPLTESDVISSLRAYRKNEFTEDDPEKLLLKFMDKKGITIEKVYLEGGGGNYLKRKDLDELLKEPLQKDPGEEVRLVCRDNVKKRIDSMVARINMNTVQKMRGYVTSLHHNFAFTGNPGTGKTVSARYLARKLQEIGVSNGVFIEVNPNALIGQYIGETGVKTDELCRKARGGVLFIDEAGQLVPGSERDFSNDAVQSLLKHMEDESETTFIFATYPDKMRDLMKADPGIKSRISNHIEFEDYTEDELVEIFMSMLKNQGYRAEDEEKTAETLKGFIKSEKETLKESFGNARVMRSLSEKAIENLSIILDREHGGKLNEFIKNSYGKDELISIPLGCIKKAAEDMNGESESMNEKEEYGFKLKVGF